MSYEQARTILSVVYRMVRLINEGQSITSAMLDEWAKQISWHSMGREK